jgi:hypothetical protein
MIYTKIKIVLLACLAFISGSVYCWGNFVKNETDGEIFVTIEYAASGICSPENRTVSRGGEINIDSKICCAQKVTVRSTTGTVKGQAYSFDTPRAGLNMTCATFRVRVFIATDKTLMAEAHLS